MSGGTTAPCLWAALHSTIKKLGIVHNYITLGISKANGPVDRMIQMLKECIQHSWTKEPTSLWTNYLALSLLLLYMTVCWMIGIVL